MYTFQFVVSYVIDLPEVLISCVVNVTINYVMTAGKKGRVESFKNKINRFLTGFDRERFDDPDTPQWERDQMVDAQFGINAQVREFNKGFKNGMDDMSTPEYPKSDSRLYPK